MRGAGQENSGILFDPAVGVYIDNVYQPRINGQFFDFFDIERLEVLRGPQGTLYGRNTNGGAIKLVTKKPSFNWTASGDVAYGSYQQTDARIYMSGPIVADKLAASVSAVSRKRDGWTTDPNYSVKLNNKNQQAVRAKLYFTPTDKFDIEVAYDVQKDRGDPGIGSQVQLFGNPTAVVNPNAVPGRDLFTSELSGPYQNHNDSNGLSVNASYQVMPELTVNSITGYRLQRASLAVPFTQTAVGLNIGSSYQFKDHFWSEEFNGTFKFDRLKGVAGIYYCDSCLTEL
jgi:iron complex outermembrane receptor protein